jgi:hypothetical protein
VIQSLGKGHTKGVFFMLKIIVPPNIQITANKLREKNLQRAKESKTKSRFKPLSSKEL